MDYGKGVGSCMTVEAGDKCGRDADLGGIPSLLLLLDILLDTMSRIQGPTKYSQQTGAVTSQQANSGSLPSTIPGRSGDIHEPESLCSHHLHQGKTLPNPNGRLLPWLSLQ